MKGRGSTRRSRSSASCAKPTSYWAEGKSVEEVAKHLEVSENTFHRWRNQYGGMKAEEAKGLRHLRDENHRLKRMVADLSLDIQMLKEVARGKLLSPTCRREAVVHLREKFAVSERTAVGR